MATKLYNTHLSKIINNCQRYHTLDCYIHLVNISSEVNNKFIIQTYSNSKTDLIRNIKDNLDATYKTISNFIDQLIELDILSYDNNLEAWLFNNMEYMVKKKSNQSHFDEENSDKYTGYTTIRDYFLTKDFCNMKIREKRILVSMAQMKDSKAGKSYNEFKIDLTKKSSRWYKIINTKSKYYAKKAITQMINKYKSVIEDIGKKVEEDKLKNYIPKKIKEFRFHLSSKVINQKLQGDAIYDTTTKMYPNEYNLVMNNIKFYEIQLSKSKITHLIRAITNLDNWLLKERIVDIIAKKYKSIQYYKAREDIKSLPAYAAAVVKSVVDEYKFAQERLKEIKYTAEDFNIKLSKNIALF